jgi:hypothetical protein
MRLSKSAFVFLWLVYGCSISLGEPARDYYFTMVDSIQFATTGSLRQHQIKDIDNNGIDELFMLYNHSYYIYSFQSHCIIFVDSSPTYEFTGGLMTDDFDLDSDQEILLTNTDRNLLLQDGLDSQNCQILVGFPNIAESSSVVNIFFGDMYENGQKIIVLAGLGYYFDGYTYLYEYVYSGDIIVFDASDWSTIWRTGCDDLWNPYLQPCRPSGESALFNDINADGKVEIIT